jgi:hypothetical protein
LERLGPVTVGADRESTTNEDFSPVVKEAKFLRKQAKKAEHAARQSTDPERVAGLRALASAYRGQAETLKRKKKQSRTC